jgi:hypothetical protein
MNGAQHALKALVKVDRLRLVADDTYAMPHKARTELVGWVSAEGA